MAKFIQLTSTTPGIGKLRVNPELLAAYFRQQNKTAIFIAAHGNPVPVGNSVIVPGLCETVTETPEEIDQKILEASTPSFMRN